VYVCKYVCVYRRSSTCGFMHFIIFQFI
jgi:hypothetical protein